jgi:2,3-bisphosphoglycerate-independent phosphoglycerate mutase
MQPGENGERGQKKSMAQFQLKPHSSIPKAEGPVMVCILDGFGFNTEDKWNGIHMAETPVYDSLRKNEERFRTVRAHGTAVGLPSDADMGNSEVGHNALGSGQVVDQGARLVDIALESGAAFSGEGFQYIKPALAEHTLHFIGLLSDGGVHSRYDQLKQFIDGSVEQGAKRIRVHILTDGRDVPDGSSVGFVDELEKDLKAACAAGCDAKIASGGGRMGVTMDRYEADWNIVKKGWYAHVLGEAPHTFTSAAEAVKTLRAGDGKPVSDQWLPPFVIVDDDKKPVGTIEDGDAVVLFNFRADRMVEISKAFEYEEFGAFDRKRWPKTLFVGMMQYDGDLRLPARFLVPPPAIDHVSGQYLAGAGVRTFACSETQKFGHVTFFWNGNRSGFFDEDLETFVEIPSDNVPFNELPDMKAAEITAAGKEALVSKRFDMVRINYANPDMVGHTGDLEAVIRACTTVDKCLGELLQVVEESNGRWLIASDHGNSDDMVQRHKKTGEALTDENGNPLPLTSHTLAPVPVAIGGAGLPANVVFSKDLPNAGLANITATYINLLGYEAPDKWEPSLLAIK